MTAPTKLAQGYTREIPLGFNGYCTVAQAAIVVPASDVQPGDVLITDRYVSLVRDVRTRHLEPDWPVLHITGDVSIVRFPHELVSVIRPVTA